MLFIFKNTNIYIWHKSPKASEKDKVLHKVLSLLPVNNQIDGCPLIRISDYFSNNDI